MENPTWKGESTCSIIEAIVKKVKAFTLPTNSALIAVFYTCSIPPQCSQMPGRPVQIVVHECPIVSGLLMAGPTVCHESSLLVPDCVPQVHST